VQLWSLHMELMEPGTFILVLLLLLSVSLPLVSVIFVSVFIHKGLVFHQLCFASVAFSGCLHCLSVSLLRYNT